MARLERNREILCPAHTPASVRRHRHSEFGRPVRNVRFTRTLVGGSRRFKYRLGKTYKRSQIPRGRGKIYGDTGSEIEFYYEPTDKLSSADAEPRCAMIRIHVITIFLANIPFSCVRDMLLWQLPAVKRDGTATICAHRQKEPKALLKKVRCSNGEAGIFL